MPAVATSIRIIILVLLISAFPIYWLGQSVVSGQSEPEMMNRRQILESIEQAEEALESNPDDMDVRYQLANLHYQAGHFTSAQGLLEPLFDSEAVSLETTALMIDLLYLAGDYEEAESIALETMQNHSTDITVQVIGHIKLAFIYYQTNRFDLAQESIAYIENIQAQGGQINYPGLDGIIAGGTLLRSFGDEAPYQIDWGDSEQSQIPFLLTDLLPVLSVEINGEPIYVIIDTGGDMFILDTDIASNLAIEPIATYTETGFAGGLSHETGLARAESLRLGDVTLTNLPITLLPTQRFSVLTGGQYPIGGIIGTKVLQQFLATIDYPAGQLILRPRTESGRNSFEQNTADEQNIELPFYLSQTHVMIGNGSLNGYDDLALWLDSGLADSTGAAFALPIETLEYLGIPVPDITNSGPGGGDTEVSIGNFPLESGGVQPLVHNNMVGVYGSFPPGLYSEHGFIIDGIISHNYLKDYAWTIDFDRMQMTFTSSD